MNVQLMLMEERLFLTLKEPRQNVNQSSENVPLADAKHCTVQSQYSTVQYM